MPEGGSAHLIMGVVGDGVMTVVLRYKHGVKSFRIVRRLLSYVYVGRPLSILDLTYGAGRFYRSSKSMIGRIIAVDVTKYKWEVEPTIFYQVDCRIFVNRVLRGEIELGDIDVIVVDPPWSSEKRGAQLRETGISKQPYHLKGVDSRTIVQVALKLSQALGKPLMYRYKEPLPCKHLVKAIAEVKMIRNRGYVYYGICV